ncbi:MAG: MarR family transcriptional regulator [Candidatus Lokiarchaeota archaeon]|nr:MarR family transcriptional regulator [Candidatus Lokiarchaeota archaeon]
MKIKKLLKYIDILLFLSNIDKVELRIISEKFDISYQTIHSLIEKWKDEGYVERKRKEILILGGDKYEYKITEKGKKTIQLLKRKLN